MLNSRTSPVHAKPTSAEDKQSYQPISEILKQSKISTRTSCFVYGDYSYRNNNPT